MSNEINQKDLINMNNKIIRDQLLWNVSNTENIVRWISTCNLNTLLLKTYLNNLKYILRVNTLWSLLISSITSTISVTQFTISDITNPTLSLAIKIVIFVTSIFTSLITGYIKVEKIQETIELVEDHKNQWSNLMFYLLSELQVSIDLRNRADHIIKKKQEDFNNINSKNIVVPSNIRETVSRILVEKRYLEYTKEKNLCCNLSHCCRINQFHNFNVANTKRKLSLFVNINKILEKEILSLLIYYPDEIKRIIFDNESDMFKFSIHTTDYNVSRDKIEDDKLTGKNLYIYTPTERACSIVKHVRESREVRSTRETRLHPNTVLDTYSSNPSFTQIPISNNIYTSSTSNNQQHLPTNLPLNLINSNQNNYNEHSNKYIYNNDNKPPTITRDISLTPIYKNISNNYPKLPHSISLSVSTDTTTNTNTDVDTYIDTPTSLTTIKSYDLAEKGKNSNDVNNNF